MFVTKATSDCMLLFIFFCVVRCQTDVSLELRELNLPQAAFEHERFVDAGIDDGESMLDNQDVDATDYQNFGFDGYRLARDIDSVENNVNVNVNSHASSWPSWDEPVSKPRNYRPTSKKFRRRSRNKINRIMQLFHEMPNTNFDYNVAHPDGHMRIQKRKNSRGKTLVLNESDEDLVPKSSNISSNQCEPVVYKAVRYLRLIERNLRNLEEDLKSFVIDSKDELP